MNPDTAEKEIGADDIINDDCSEEYIRLYKPTPLKTITHQSYGPMLSQITSGMYGMVDSIWISKFIGEIGLTAVATVFVIDYCAIAFGHFINTAASTRLAYLFSQKKHKEANQVVIDLIRTCFIIGVLVPLILFPLSKPIIRWLKASEEVTNMGFKYLIPRLAFTCTTCIYLTCCGVLQAEGRSWWYGAAQICSLLLNMLVFDPLFLYLFKSVIGASLATIVSELIPCSIILYYLFTKRLTCQPDFSMFFNPFSQETYAALKTGLASLVMHVSTTIPNIFLQKFIAIAANNINQYDMVMAIWNTTVRLYQLSLCIVVALNTAYLPSASFAFGKHNNQRVLDLTLHVSWISTAWSTFVGILICFFPKLIARMWSTDSTFLYWAGEILPICFYTIILCSLKFVFVSYLQACGYPFFAMVLSLTTELLPLPIFASIMHYTGNKQSPVRIFIAYIFNDVFSFIVGCLIVTPKMIKMWKDSKPSLQRGSSEDSDPIQEL